MSKETTRSATKTQWDEAVQAKVSAGASRREAVRQVCREQPELRQRLVDETTDEANRR